MLAIRAGQVRFCTVSVHDQTVVEEIRAWFITVGFIFGTHVRLTKLVHSPAQQLSITRLKKNHKSDARLPPSACVFRLFVKKKRHIQQTYLINKWIKAAHTKTIKIRAGRFRCRAELALVPILHYWTRIRTEIFSGFVTVHYRPSIYDYFAGPVPCGPSRTTQLATSTW